MLDLLVGGGGLGCGLLGLALLGRLLDLLLLLGGSLLLFVGVRIGIGTRVGTGLVRVRVGRSLKELLGHVRIEER